MTVRAQQRRLRGRLPLGALALATLLAGCQTELASLGGQCQLNSECDSPLVCRLRRCRRACAGNRDCPSGSSCVRDARGLGACLLPDEVSCSANSECPEPLLCLGGGCTEACRESRDCVAGSICTGEEGMRFCANMAGDRCVRDGDCAEAGLVCGLDQRCRFACAADRDCPEGAFCESGSCVVPPETDGGIGDGGVADGGAMDASVDGGIDQGVMDDAGMGTPCTTAGDCTPPTGAATVDCIDERCAVTSCDSGLGDCDLVFDNGCEADLTTPRSCGACDVDCGAAGVCTTGSCDQVVDIAVGSIHLCFARSGGAVACVGRTENGELGLGTTSTLLASPQAMMTGDSYTRVAVGPGLSCVHEPGGSNVACTGNNFFGQIGDGTTVDRTVPTTAMPAVDGEVAIGGNFRRITVDRAFACALEGTTLSCWGDEIIRMDGLSGNLTGPTPQTSAALPGPPSAFDLGRRNACGVFAGQVFCWGEDGPWSGTATSTSAHVTPTRIGTFDDAIDVSVSQDHGCAVRSGGTVECWGDNTSLQCGDGFAMGTSSPDPAPVAGVTDAVSVETGPLHTCVLRSGGGVACWGYGQALGAAAADFTATPTTPVGLESGVVELSVGGVRGCALKTDATVWCWGAGSDARGTAFGDPTDFATWATPQLHPSFPAIP